MLTRTYGLGQLLVLLLSFDVAQAASYRLIRGGQIVGEAAMSQRIDPDGSKTVELRLMVRGPQGETRVRQQSRYDAQGRPLRIYQEMGTLTRRIVSQTIVDFNPTGARLVTGLPGQRNVSEVALYAEANRANLTEFWFLRDQPAIGAVVRCWQFNLEARRWEWTEVRYLGIQPSPLNRELRKVVVLRGDRQVVSYFDADGMPAWVQDPSGLVLERLPDTAASGKTNRKPNGQSSSDSSGGGGQRWADGP